MSDLTKKRCKACEGNIDPMEHGEIEKHLEEIDGWKSVDDHHITKSYEFDDFRQALDFVNAVGAIAEDQGHHPDILLMYGKVELTYFTHSIDGLHENDFIMAAKSDECYEKYFD